MSNATPRQVVLGSIRKITECKLEEQARKQRSSMASTTVHAYRCLL